MRVIIAKAKVLSNLRIFRAVREKATERHTADSHRYTSLASKTDFLPDTGRCTEVFDTLCITPEYEVDQED